MKLTPGKKKLVSYTCQLCHKPVRKFVAVGVIKRLKYCSMGCKNKVKTWRAKVKKQLADLGRTRKCAEKQLPFLYGQLRKSRS